MNDEWKEIFGIMSNIRNELLKSSDISAPPKSEFMNHFLLQITVMWTLQKYLFFNDDQNYFNKIFQLIERQDPNIPFKNFSEFMNSLLIRLSDLSDNHISYDPQFGKLRGCKSAIFLELEYISMTKSFPNDLYFTSFTSRSFGKISFKFPGIFTLLDQLDFRINGVFLGSLYEWLMSSEKKRKSGVYYSPVELASYITRFSLRMFLMDQIGVKTGSLREKWTDFIESLDKSGFLSLYNILKDLTILDPAVGTGQFLESAADELLALYSIVIENLRDLDESVILNIYSDQSHHLYNSIDLTKLPDKTELEFYILFFLIFPKSLYGVDIDPFVIPFTKARLFIYIAQRIKDYMVNSPFILPFKCNLQIGDALLVNWNNIFTELLTKPNNFSLVITNPPYIGESDNKRIFRKYSHAFPKYYEGKIDLWYLFFHLALDQAQNGGIVSFLATNYWLTASGASKLRKRLFEETFILEFIDFGENRVFQGAHGIHSSILTIKKAKTQNPSIDCVLYTKKIPKGEKLLDRMSDQLIFQIEQRDLTLNNWDNYLHFIPPDVSLILKSITNSCSSIRESSYNVKEGLITGLNKITRRQIEKYRYPSTWINHGIFILDITNIDDQNTIDTFTTKEKRYLRPIYKSSSIKSYSTRIQTNQRVLYLVRNEIEISTIPNIKQHLDQYHIAMNNSLDHPPYLNRPRKKEIFSSPKLITPQRARTTQFAYNSTEWFAAQDVYFICEERNSVLNLKLLLFLLQSKVSFFWFSWMGKKKGSQLEFFGESVSNFPIPQKLRNSVLIARITDYLIFLNSLENVPKEFQQIQEFIEEKITNIIAYKCYFFDLILTIPSHYQLFKDVCNFLLDTLEVIDVERFLRLRYSIYVADSEVLANKIEFSDLRAKYLSKINKSFEKIRSEEKILELYNLVRVNALVLQIEKFYDSKNR